MEVDVMAEKDDAKNAETPLQVEVEEANYTVQLWSR